MTLQLHPGPFDNKEACIMWALTACQPMVERVASRYHLDKDDLQQEVACAVLHVWDRLTGIPEGVDNFLFVTVRNFLINYMRREMRHRRAQSLETPIYQRDGNETIRLGEALFDEHSDVERCYEQETDQTALYAAIARLPLDEQYYLIQRYQFPCEPVVNRHGLPSQGRARENVRDGARRHLRADTALRRAVLAS
jgi:RNA polymerase sigma factor (sigma-70 family)